MKVKNILSTLALAAFSVMLSSCGGNKKAIVGCWSMVKVEVEAQGSNTDAIDIVKSYYEEDNPRSFKICFSEAGGFNSFYGEIEMRDGEVVMDDGGTYAINGDVLTVSFEDEGKHTDLVLQLSGNTLKIGEDVTERVQSGYAGDLNEGDITKAIAFQIFERVN